MELASSFSSCQKNSRYHRDVVEEMDFGAQHHGAGTKSFISCMSDVKYSDTHTQELWDVA